ncbi:MAG: SET domain-containing protein [Bacteroidetes bacterium]|nr:SET domain-containing protein [Bacteroidota bacterium]
MSIHSNSFPDELNLNEAEYLYISTSLIIGAGKGLFTAISIHKNELISIFKGELLHRKSASNRIKSKEDNFFMNLPNGKILDAKYTDCFAKYANDAKGVQSSSYKNNALITVNHKNQICLLAKVNIKAGSEIFCSYGKAYWEHQLTLQ